MRTLVAAVVLTLAAPLAAAPSAPSAKPAAPATVPAAPAAKSAASAAAAQPAAPPVQLPPIDLSAIPAPCQPLAVQANAPDLRTALATRILLASCVAERAIAPLALCDCADSVHAIDTAAAPALALLDGVIDVADPAQQVVAEHAEGQLYTGFVTRLVATLPAIGAEASDSERALRDMRKQTLDAQLAPWREAALTAYQHVVDIARAHPELARNPAAATAVRDSQQHLAAEVPVQQG